MIQNSYNGNWICQKCGYVEAHFNPVGNRTATGAQAVQNRAYTKAWNNYVNNQQRGTDMLYCHYEHFTLNIKSPLGLGAGSVQPYTRLMFASYTNKSSVAYASFAHLKDIIIPLIKQIPASQRSFEPLYNIWTLPTYTYDTLRKLLDAVASHVKVTFIEHFNLEAWLDDPDGSKAARSAKAVKPEDFFYNTTQPTTSGTMPIALLEAKLEELLKEVDTLIKLPSLSKEEKAKLYKKAARKFHPDLNMGDAKKMTEFNYLWQEYSKLN